MAESKRLVIPTSEGRLIEIEEGVLDYQPPPPKPPRYKSRPPRKKQPPKKPRIKFILSRSERPKAAVRDVPGFAEWMGRRTSQTLKYKTHGRKLGHCDGYNPRMMKKILAEAKQKAIEDVAKIEAASGPIEDAAAREALTGAIEVLRTPVNQQTKLAAARLVLDFTKAKPASKSEVTVNAAEKWLESLDK
jgi:hypothetical protein